MSKKLVISLLLSLQLMPSAVLAQQQQPITISHPKYSNLEMTRTYAEKGGIWTNVIDIQFWVTNASEPRESTWILEDYTFSKPVTTDPHYNNSCVQAFGAFSGASVTMYTEPCDPTVEGPYWKLHLAQLHVYCSTVEYNMHILLFRQ